jgi:hypothetical protein
LLFCVLYFIVNKMPRRHPKPIYASGSAEGDTDSAAM